MNGRDALADIESLNEPFEPFKVRSSSSASGSAILLIFEFSMVLLSSATIFEMTIPSKAMMVLLISVNILNLQKQKLLKAIVHMNIYIIIYLTKISRSYIINSSMHMRKEKL